MKDRVRVSYALSGARDNLEMESFISQFKTENRSLLPDAQTLANLQLVSGRKDRMRQWGTTALDDRTPSTHGICRDSVPRS